MAGYSSDALAGRTSTAGGRLSAGSNEGVIVTEEEVVQLLEAAPPATQLWEAFAERLAACEERLHALHMQEAGSIPILAVADAFSLNRFELGCLFLCLSVELDRKYEKLFGYLLDDITCKSPTPELAMQLFCRTATERIAVWTAFAQKQAGTTAAFYRGGYGWQWLLALSTIKA